MASLLRAIDWRQVRRLILVGDPKQFPPIGRGRVFADTIRWLNDKNAANIARLEHNLRQLENTVEGRGTAILRFADLFIGQPTSSTDEDLLTKVHTGGDVDADLRVVYWDDPVALSDTLIRAIEKEMEDHTGEVLDPDKPFDLWRTACDWKP